MKVLFDTNVIVDVLGQREPHYQYSRNVFKMAQEQKIIGIVGAGSISDIYYLTKRNYPDLQQSMQAIIDLITVLIPVDTKVSDIRDAIGFGFSDFEDAIVSATALREQADYIISRNSKDFDKSQVKAISPMEFLVLPDVLAITEGN